MRRIYFDMEFTGLYRYTKPISIGMVSGNQTFYGEFESYITGFTLKEDFEFYRRFIKPGLKFKETTFRSTPDSVEVRGSADYITLQIEKWMKKTLDGEKAEMWSDCLAYDWVLFCGLWGHALDLPEYIYYIPMDLCTLLYTKGIDPDISREEFAYEKQDHASEWSIYDRKHNALHDARIIKMCVEKAEKL